MNTVLTAQQLIDITDVLVLVFQSIINLVYTIIITIVDFFTRPDVLGAIAVLFLIIVAYSWLKNKKMG